MKFSSRYLLSILLLVCFNYGAVANNWNNCNLSDINNSKNIKLDKIYNFKEVSQKDLFFDKYSIKTINNLLTKIDLYIDKKLAKSISFDSDIPYRYKSFLYESSSIEQPYKFIILEKIARNDDSDEIEGYYMFLLKDGDLIRSFYLSYPVPIYDYYYFADYENYEEMDSHNVTEYLSVFTDNNILIISLNKNILKLPNDEKTSHFIQDDNNFYLCQKII